MSIDVIKANYTDPEHSHDISYLLNCYAQDPMGGGFELPEYVKINLASALSNLPNAFSFLCYVDHQPAGLVNCFEGFSTFTCKPLMNIHDIIVNSAFRGRGISQQLLASVESLAIARGCCKITLEVLDGNLSAKHAYKKFGFSGYELDPTMGKALFWEKPL